MYDWCEQGLMRVVRHLRVALDNLLDGCIREAEAEEEGETLLNHLLAIRQQLRVPHLHAPNLLWLQMGQAIINLLSPLSFTIELTRSRIKVERRKWWMVRKIPIGMAEMRRLGMQQRSGAPPRA